MGTPRASIPARDERGAALVIVMLTSAVGFMLGLGILFISEAEELRARSFAERTRSRAAAEGAVRLAASWLATPHGAVGLPAPGAWISDRRIGDSDLDGRSDDACNGAFEEGRWQGFPLVAASEDENLATLVTRACGDSAAPDLLLEPGPALDVIASSLGDDVVLERLSLYAGPAVGSSRSTVTIEAVAAIRRGRLVVSRVTAVGRVSAMPALRSDDAIIAGGDVHLARGAAVAWGGVHAGGDILLPRLDAAGALRSGLPRRPEAAAAAWTTGGATDWNLDTSEREYVLTELIGRTIQGVLVLSPEVVAPVLPDPWLTLRAAGSIVIAGRRAGPVGARQPWPHDPRSTPLQDDLSFLFGSENAPDPLASGRVERLAEALGGTTAAGGAARRFLLEREGRGEPRWRENGTGPARTAQEWLSASDDAPVTAAFVTGGLTRPASVTLKSPRGIVIIDAGAIVLTAPGDAPAIAANMPGEPFLDTGIDADGDGEMDPGTAGNGRWDRDLDADGVPDEGRTEGWELGADLGPSYFVPNRDEDPARLAMRPHEAFLNYAYPADGIPAGVRVAFRAEADGLAAPVADLDDDGFIRPGTDLTTTLARDERGAQVFVSAHGHALIVNVSGDVLVGPGYELLGGIRAAGRVELEEGARVRFDERLARDGRLGLALPLASLTAIAFPHHRLRGRQEAAPVTSEDSEPATPEPAEPDRREPGDGRGQPPQPGGRGPGAGGGRNEGQPIADLGGRRMETRRN